MNDGLTAGERGERVQALALEHGFPLHGIALVPDGGGALREAHLGEWIARGLHGPLQYMPATQERRRNLHIRFPWAKSVLCLGVFYEGFARGKKGRDLEAHVARYARGRDYHRVFEKRLKRLSAALRHAGLCDRAHYYTDTGPVLERAWAERAGLGWIGKNTCLINSKRGSFFLLAEIILDCAAAPDQAATPHCGSCRRCIDACPTQALSPEGELNAQACLVTWNIELNGRTPRELWERQGEWAAGCDICQQVCPYNSERRVAPADPELSAPLAWQSMSLAQCIAMDRAEFDHRFTASTLRRTGLKGLRLGAITAAGNCASEDCRAALTACLNETDDEINARARWALAALEKN